MYISGGWYNETLQSTGPIKARNLAENNRNFSLMFCGPINITMHLSNNIYFTRHYPIKIATLYFIKSIILFVVEILKVEETQVSCLFDSVEAIE